MKKIYFLIVTALLSVACTKDDDNITPKELSVATQDISLEVGKVTKIYATTTSDREISYVSENEQIASVDENGKVLAKLKGETDITISDGKKSQTIKVSVLPTSSLFFEPILVASSQEFKEKYAQSGGEFVANGFQDFYTRQTYDVYIFEKGTNKEYRIAFYNDLKTNDLVIEIPDSDFYTKEKTLHWISERFLPLKQESDFLHFISADGKTQVSWDNDENRANTQIRIFNLL